METRRADGLEIDEDLAFARRSWRVQRASWVGMGVVVVLALAGLLGSGPLSRHAVSLPGLLRVEYQRFTRYEAPQTLTVRLEPAATQTAEARVWIDRRYLDDARVEAVTPPPARVEAAGDRLVYAFPISRRGEPVAIVVALQSERIGPVGGGSASRAPPAPRRSGSSSTREAAVESVMRAAAIYGLLLVVFRFTGNRSLGQITTFDFILLLIISEAIQNGMVGNDYSVTNAVLLVLTLVMLDIGLSLVKSRVPIVEKWLEGVPVVIVEHGRPLLDRMRQSRVDVSDVLTAARKLHGLERMDQIKYAILERGGDISIIPAE